MVIVVRDDDEQKKRDLLEGMEKEIEPLSTFYTVSKGGLCPGYLQEGRVYISSKLLHRCEIPSFVHNVGPTEIIILPGHLLTQEIPLAATSYLSMSLPSTSWIRNQQRAKVTAECSCCSANPEVPSLHRPSPDFMRGYHVKQFDDLPEAIRARPEIRFMCSDKVFTCTQRTVQERYNQIRSGTCFNTWA